jgi:hypothetical protein
MPLQDTLNWFKEALPNPTSKNQKSQLGVHVEEFVEMLVEMNVEGYNSALADAIVSLNVLANGLKKDTLTSFAISTLIPIHINPHQRCTHCGNTDNAFRLWDFSRHCTSPKCPDNF